MHSISNLFYFGTVLYMFQTVSPSIIGSPRLYIQHQVYVILKFQKWVQLLVSVQIAFSGIYFTNSVLTFYIT